MARGADKIAAMIRKRRRGRGYEATDGTNTVTAGHTDWRSDQRNDQRNDCRDDSRNGSGGSQSSRQDRPPRVPDLPAAEQLNAPCYLHAYIDSKDNVKKASHLLRDHRQFLELQKLYETLKSGSNAQVLPMI
jgi:hypothetical protein